MLQAVAVEHSSLTAFLEHRHCPGCYESQPEDAEARVLYVLAFTFDPSVGVVWCTLITGGTLYVAKPGAWLDPRYLNQMCVSSSITAIWGVPTPFTLVLQESRGELSAFLVDLFLMGEVLPTCVVSLVLEQNPHVRLVNLYGPAECTITATSHQCSLAESTFVSIGVPHGNTCVLILGTGADPVPIGSPGELYLSGPKVAKGYVNQPDLTINSFVEGPRQHTILYRTGDRARWLPSGNLQFLGRFSCDFQLKLNGQRIELGEIEEVLRQQIEHVQDAVVSVRKTPAGVDQLVAYVLPEDIKASTVTQICHRELPTYMVPSLVVPCAAW